MSENGTNPRGIWTAAADKVERNETWSTNGLRLQKSNPIKNQRELPMK